MTDSDGFGFTWGIGLAVFGLMVIIISLYWATTHPWDAAVGLMTMPGAVSLAWGVTIVVSSTKEERK